MRKKPKKTEAQIRADNAEGQRKLRAHRSQNKLCLQCGVPAVNLPSGLLSRHCKKHLLKDRRRKAAESKAKKPRATTTAAPAWRSAGKSDRNRSAKTAAKAGRTIPLPWAEDLLPSKNRMVLLSKVSEVTETGDGEDEGTNKMYELPWL